MLKFGLGMLLSALAVTMSQAQQLTASNEVAVTGCLIPAVQSGCLIIRDQATGQTYEITSANPKPDTAQRLVIAVRGTKSNNASICQQGPILTEITWDYTKMRCEADPAGGPSNTK